MSDRIRSKNALFKGQLVKKPKVALIVGQTLEGDDIYQCPDCGKEATLEDCDVIGAEPNCVFCTSCHCEFKS